MKNNHFEHFIQKNRNHFDHAEPPAHLWHRISAEMQPPTPTIRKLQMTRWHYAIAASVLILIGAGLGWWLAPRMASAPDPMMAEFIEAESYYQQRIATSVSQLREYGALPVVEADIQEFNGFIDELKVELDKVPPAHRPAVIRSLIQNYQVKLDMLEHIIHQIEPTKQKNYESL